ncbi:MAG: hypothetical protein FVQ83_00105 [Chloroflexi bacterium]|nr:hypothetical protein [Chloroflexota bacterium]
MIRKLSYSFPLLIVLVGIAILGSGCEYNSNPFAPTPTIQGTYMVDPIFREFHEQIGGWGKVGPAISVLFWEDHQRLQYTEAGLMVFDPLASPSYFLAPLGEKLGYSDPLVPNPETDDIFWVGGHIVYDKFVRLYENLGGEAVVGRPLTEVIYNIEKERYEQHFENLGFYIKADSLENDVRLLAYGVYDCDYGCRYYPDFYAITYRQSALPEPFLSEISRLGSSFVGQMLTDPYLTTDGKVEVIFENIVITTDPNIPQSISYRPIVEQVGFEALPLTTRMDSPLVVFFIIEGDMGFNIPIVINEYISQHGGYEVTGNPISDIFMLSDGVYRQCFTNICLDYHANREENMRITPSALGTLYRAYYYNPVDEPGAINIPQPLENLQILTWEENTLITSAQPQVIHAVVLDYNIPIQNMQPLLSIISPDGLSSSIYRFPPTNSEGNTQITIPPTIAANGTIIAYEVCLENLDVGRVCAAENYLIWGN